VFIKDSQSSSILKLQPWKVSIVYRPGTENSNADGVSRQEWEPNGGSAEDVKETDGREPQPDLSSSSHGQGFQDSRVNLQPVVMQVQRIGGQYELDTQEARDENPRPTAEIRERSKVEEGALNVAGGMWRPAPHKE